MQSLRVKFGERRNDWTCCFCCHVRTGTIFIGVWNLVRFTKVKHQQCIFAAKNHQKFSFQMLHVMALPIMAFIVSYPKDDLESVLPTPLSEVDNINFELSGSNLEVILNNRSSRTPQPLLSHSYSRELWEHKTLSNRKCDVIS